MSPSAFAQWCLKNLDLDVWMSQLTLSRRLAGIHGHAFTAAGLLGALQRAGWVEAHPTMPGIYALNSKCWMPKQKAPAATNSGGSFLNKT